MPLLPLCTCMTSVRTDSLDFINFIPSGCVANTNHLRNTEQQTNNLFVPVFLTFINCSYSLHACYRRLQYHWSYFQNEENTELTFVLQWNQRNVRGLMWISPGYLRHIVDFCPLQMKECWNINAHRREPRHRGVLVTSHATGGPGTELPPPATTDKELPFF